MRLYLGDPISELCRSNDTTRESEHVHAAAASTRKVAVIDFVSQPSPAISNPKVTAVAGRLGRRSKVEIVSQKSPAISDPKVTAVAGRLGRRSKVEILSRKSPAICVVATSQLGDRVRFSREKSEMQSPYHLLASR